MAEPQAGALLLRADAAVLVLVLDRDVDAHAFEDGLDVLHYFRRRTRRSRRLVDRTVMDTHVDAAAGNALEPAFGDTVVREGLVGRRRRKSDGRVHRRRGEEMHVDGRSRRVLARGWDGGRGRRIVDRLLNFDVGDVCRTTALALRAEPPQDLARLDYRRRDGGALVLPGVGVVTRSLVLSGAQRLRGRRRQHLAFGRKIRSIGG